MPRKRTTVTCPRCQRTLPRDHFASLPRTDRPGKTKPDGMCRDCRPVVDAEREAHRRRPNTTVLCACGCGKPTARAPVDSPRWGWVRGQPMRYLRGHGSAERVYPAAPYVVDPVTGCWVWQLARDQDGYGRMTRNGKNIPAHRAYFEDRYGRLLPGFVPDHVCPHGPNRACVNPEHMRALPMPENSRRKQSNKLTPQMAHEIRRLKGTESQYVTAARYGVSQAHISDIQIGRHWPINDADPHRRQP